MQSRKLFRYTAAILWSGCIFFMCFLPGSDLPKAAWLNEIQLDKIIHASSYFILFLLIVRIPQRRNTTIIIIAATICIIQGVLIECVQGSSLIQNRSFDLYDIAANIAGVILAILYKSRNR